MTEAGLVQIAESFWRSCGGRNTPPQDITPFVSRMFPVSIVLLSNLSITTIERWLAVRHVPYRFLCQNRALCGCLVAVRGYGVIFVDISDPLPERRFTIAHEVAHFLLDYDAPRRRALDLFGEVIRSAIDGERELTPTERIDAVLSTTPLGVFFNLMARNAQGSIDQGSILRAENRADRLALELLAPANEVLARLPNTNLQQFERARLITDLLIKEYGLPQTVARSYTVALLSNQAPASTAQWLGI